MKPSITIFIFRIAWDLLCCHIGMDKWRRKKVKKRQLKRSSSDGDLSSSVGSTGSELEAAKPLHIDYTFLYAGTALASYGTWLAFVYRWADEVHVIHVNDCNSNTILQQGSGTFNNVLEGNIMCQ